METTKCKSDAEKPHRRCPYEWTNVMSGEYRSVISFAVPALGDGGRMLFSVKRCCMYLNIEEYLTLVRSPIESNWSNWLKAGPAAMSYIRC